MGWPLTTAGNVNPSDPIEVEVIVTGMISLARSFVECRAFTALDQSCRWTLAAAGSPVSSVDQSPEQDPTASLGHPCREVLSKGPRGTAPSCSERAFWGPSSHRWQVPMPPLLDCLCKDIKWIFGYCPFCSFSLFVRGVVTLVHGGRCPSVPRPCYSSWVQCHVQAS